MWLRDPRQQQAPDVTFTVMCSYRVCQVSVMRTEGLAQHPKEKAQRILAVKVSPSANSHETHPALI
jgi:hypothetical protein